MTRLRDQAWRLELQRYPQQFEIRAAYGDMDSFRHLNNVALARYFEEGRATMNMSAFGVESVVQPPDAYQLLVAGVVIDYVGQGAYPGQVGVAVGLARIGRSSFTQAAALFQGGRCIALSESTMVYAVGGQARAIPAEVRERLLPFTIHDA